MQCAAMSAPQLRSSPRSRATHRLRPDRVHRGREQAAIVERVEAGEGAEALRAGRLDRRAQPLDDRVRGRERDPGRLVGGLASHARESKAAEAALHCRVGPSPLTSWTWDPAQLLLIAAAAFLYYRRAATLAVARHAGAGLAPAGSSGSASGSRSSRSPRRSTSSARSSSSSSTCSSTSCSATWRRSAWSPG